MLFSQQILVKVSLVAFSLPAVNVLFPAVLIVSSLQVLAVPVIAYLVLLSHVPRLVSGVRPVLGLKLELGN